jgi:hypothetical protein
MNTTPTTPRIEAKTLLNEFAVKQAALKQAVAPHITEIKQREAAINEATAAYKSELEALEARLKKLALEQGEEIFGADSRSLTENGFILQLRTTEAVQCDDEAAAIRELMHLSRTARTQDAQIAALACLRTKTELDKEYISRHFEAHAEWFAVFGISVVEKDSASLREKPPAKPKAAKKPKAKKAAKTELEAAA